MEYKRFNNKIVLRIDRGEEVVSKLQEVGVKENIKLASISGIGASDHVDALVYSVEEKKYYNHEFVGDFEITNITGNINTKDGEYYSHLHITIGDSEGKCFGGHLKSAVISGTCEIVIDVIDGVVDRKVDDITGLNVFKF